MSPDGTPLWSGVTAAGIGGADCGAMVFGDERFWSAGYKGGNAVVTAWDAASGTRLWEGERADLDPVAMIYEGGDEVLLTGIASVAAGATDPGVVRMAPGILPSGRVFTGASWVPNTLATGGAGELYLAGTTEAFSMCYALAADDARAWIRALR